MNIGIFRKIKANTSIVESKSEAPVKSIFESKIQELSSMIDLENGDVDTIYEEVSFILRQVVMKDGVKAANRLVESHLAKFGWSTINEEDDPADKKKKDKDPAADDEPMNLDDAPADPKAAAVDPTTDKPIDQENDEASAGSADKPIDDVGPEAVAAADKNTDAEAPKADDTPVDAESDPIPGSTVGGGSSGGSVGGKHGAAAENGDPKQLVTGKEKSIELKPKEHIGSKAEEMYYINRDVSNGKASNITVTKSDGTIVKEIPNADQENDVTLVSNLIQELGIDMVPFEILDRIIDANKKDENKPGNVQSPDEGPVAIKDEPKAPEQKGVKEAIDSKVNIGPGDKVKLNNNRPGVYDVINYDPSEGIAYVRLPGYKDGDYVSTSSIESIVESVQGEGMVSLNKILKPFMESKDKNGLQLLVPNRGDFTGQVFADEFADDVTNGFEDELESLSKGPGENNPNYDDAVAAINDMTVKIDGVTLNVIINDKGEIMAGDLADVKRLRHKGVSGVTEGKKVDDIMEDLSSNLDTVRAALEADGLSKEEVDATIENAFEEPNLGTIRDALNSYIGGVNEGIDKDVVNALFAETLAEGVEVADPDTETLPGVETPTKPTKKPSTPLRPAPQIQPKPKAMSDVDLFMKART